MKTMLLALLLLPFITVAQKAPDFTKRNAEFLKEAIELYGFKSFTSEKSPLAGKEDYYPKLTILITIDISNQCDNNCDLLKFALSKTKFFQKIADEYCSMMLLCYPDQTQARILYTLNNAKESSNINTEIYYKSLHSQPQPL